jgi:hypothetical protein
MCLRRYFWKRLALELILINVGGVTQSLEGPLEQKAVGQIGKFALSVLKLEYVPSLVCGHELS